MRKLNIAVPLALALLAPLNTFASGDFIGKPGRCDYISDESAKCKCHRDNYKYYKERMRRGYTASEYNELERKRRYYRDKAFSCKN